MSPNCAENIVRYLHMKKLLGILVLGLLWCNVGFAEYSSKLENVELLTECTDLKIRKWRNGDDYTFNFENYSGIDYEISHVTFATEGNDQMFVKWYKKRISSYHKARIVVRANNLLHKLVKKIHIGCGAV